MSLYFREHELHEFHESPCGVLSLLIAYELHEYRPDGIRVIDLRDLRFVLFVRLTRATFGSCSLKHRNSRLFRLNIYEGGGMSTTIHQTKSYLYLPDTNNLFFAKKNTEISLLKTRLIL